MQGFLPDEQMIIDYMFKNVDAGKKLMEALKAKLVPKNAAPVAEYELDSYKSNAFIMYEDNYELLLPYIGKSIAQIEAMGKKWNYIKEGNYIIFQTDKLTISVNYININFNEPKYLLPFMQSSHASETIDKMTENELALQCKIMQDKQYLLSVDKRFSSGWRQVGYMINYQFFVEQLKG